MKRSKTTIGRPSVGQHRRISRSMSFSPATFALLEERATREHKPLTHIAEELILAAVAAQVKPG